MGIFKIFNNQGLNDDIAFEELCCQLFETWGIRERQFNANWEFLDIRGEGGDGGIEAYWHNIEDDCFIGIQAKWFRQTITTPQYGQIRKSIDTALRLRPSITQYIVCVPHKLTSLRNGKGGTVNKGEEEAWKAFRDNIEKAYPDLDLVLWDEHRIENLLQQPANEGRWRFWFERSAVNPDTVRLALREAIEGLKDRYIPEITDNGKLAAFLDNFFGTVESRSLALKDIGFCLEVCHDLLYAIDSFMGIKEGLSDDLASSAAKFHNAVHTYVDVLSTWQRMLTMEPKDLIEVDDIKVDYGAIEGFESDIHDLKTEYRFTAHVDKLIELIDMFRDLPSEYEICKTIREAFGFPHCFVFGDQGTGKTCGFANEASSFLSSGRHLPIFIRGSEIDVQSGWREIISSALGLSEWSEAELWQALSSSAAMHDVHEGGIVVRAKVAVFVDGLDERHSVSRWTTLIRQGDAITKEYPRIKFAYSSRPHEVEPNDFDVFLRCLYRIDGGGDVSAWELFDSYIEHYSIDLAGNTRYKRLLRTPMELRMFCTAYNNKRIDEEVSTCLTELVNAEVDRLEDEYAVREVKTAGLHDKPVRCTLIALAKSFLQSSEPRDRTAIGAIVENEGISSENVSKMLDFLERYGILATSRRPGATSVSPGSLFYQPGSRHLWDYFMAVVLMETERTAAANSLLHHGDAAYMYAILLIERHNTLPLSCESLVDVLGINRVRKLTINALASADKKAAGEFKQWVLDEMARGTKELFDIVDGIVVPVAGEQDHLLGPTMLDEFMRTFSTPVARDRIWSMPRRFFDDYRISMYYERDAVRHLPGLHEDDAWNQMPVLFAWCLSAVSNLKRRHCRNELVRWALCNPSEFANLFDKFVDCDDPQVRQDMFAIAEEVVCQGIVGVSTKKRLACAVMDSVFQAPDKPGNRDAAIRYYGRILIERCIADGIISSSEADRCRPSYEICAESGVLPIYAAAAGANKMSGYETIHYDLARYVLVDRLEGAFGIPRFHTNGEHDSEDVLRLVRQSADMMGIDILSFEGWVISAAYQYLLDHGYDPDIFAGIADADGYRRGGIDREISRSFGKADHGSQSTVMTLAEKYVWCARNEICGYLADRIPKHMSDWQGGTRQESYEFAHDYSALLSYHSPLFEATVNGIMAEREGATPSFPAEFSCDDDAACSEQELNNWIRSGSVDAIISLLDHTPDVALSIRGEAVPVAIYASDWSICGKQAYGWAYCGVMEPAEFSKLTKAESVAIAGYDRVSTFVTSIDVGATYISPVEFISAPWIQEYSGERGRTKKADVQVVANPLSGSDADSLIDIGDFWYRFPSKLAMDLCGITRTDGLRYFNSSDEVVFEDVDYGEPFRKHYQALLANKDKLFTALNNKDLHLLWYVALRRAGNRLAEERLPHIEKPFEVSWLIWVDADGKYHSCQVSDK